MTSRKIRSSTLTSIENALDEIYAEDPTGFKIVLSEIQRRSGISRPTLSKKEVRKHIDSYVSELPKPYTLLSNQNSVKKFENHKLREECKRLREKNRVLSSQLTDLFYRIYGESIDVNKLLNDPNTRDVDGGE